MEYQWMCDIAASKMEFFVTKSRKWLETVVDCYYTEICLKCDSTPESNYGLD